MLSFRVDQTEAAEAKRWAKALGVYRSELLREALHRHLVELRSENEASILERSGPIDEEQTLAATADWGPAEDWADWGDATR